ARSGAGAAPLGGVRARPVARRSRRSRGRVRDRPVLRSAGGGELLSPAVPTDPPPPGDVDRSEHSELDDALFGATTPLASNPGVRPDDVGDLAELDAELFGEPSRRGEVPTPPEARTRRERREAGGAGTERTGDHVRRFGLGALVVLVVLGVGAAAYAVFGQD